jgi:hypothetical protein
MVEARREFLEAYPSDWGPVWEGVWFREEMLESTGLIREWDEDGYADVPLDREKEPGWRDNVKLELETYASDEDQADAVAARAESALRALVDIDEITWTPTFNEEGESIEISVSLEPSSDVLDAYERIVAAPARAWMHGEDEKGFLCSRWQPPLAEEAIFLDPEITQATVTCEYWSSPKRLQRRTAVSERSDN